MYANHIVSKEPSSRQLLGLFGCTPVVMAIFATLCLALGGHAAQARTIVDPGDGPIGGPPPPPLSPPPPVPPTVPTPAQPSYVAWTSAHGNADNTGFARVNTAPAAFANQIGFANVGHVAPGANPVTGPDGTVYIGNLEGELIALRADGKLYWKRKLNPEHGAIFAAPAVGADGSVYVVSNMGYVDHRSGVTTPLHTCFLHKFSPGGAWVYWKAFPKSTLYPFTDGGASTAPPNIWHGSAGDVIMIPVIYKGLDRELRVIAFSTNGTVLASKRVTLQVTGIVTQSPLDGLLTFLDNCIVHYFSFTCFDFNGPPAQFPFPEVGWPQPGVAVWEGSPYVWVADGIRNTVLYQFDPATGFSETSRFSDPKDRFSSPPVALDNLVAAVGTENEQLKFEH